MLSTIIKDKRQRSQTESVGRDFVHGYLTRGVKDTERSKRIITENTNVSPFSLTLTHTNTTSYTPRLITVIDKQF